MKVISAPKNKNKERIRFDWSRFDLWPIWLEISERITNKPKILRWSGEGLKGRCLPWSKEEEGAYIFWMKQVPVVKHHNPNQTTDNWTIPAVWYLFQTSSEWLLFYANSWIFQPYHEKKKLDFNERMMKSTLETSKLTIKPPMWFQSLTNL
jgi:hypothetical protein